MIDPGFLFMLGLEGTRPSAASARLLRDTGACGVLLLARNIEDARQTRALTEGLVQKVGRPLLFSVDHEGGWVLRFRAGVTPFPGNAALGAGGTAKDARAVGAAMARELAPLGIRLNLAPVVDVAGGYNPGIGIRSFGSDPKQVGKLGAALAKGMEDNGVWACAKHFPGKGAASVDAHVELPVIKLAARAFERVHLAPFADAVKAGVSCVMTSHVLFPAYDRVPATFSRKITTGLLRDKLGFDGVIISDDLCMGAIASRWPIQVAAEKALHAGHDILLIAHQEHVQREAVELLRAAAQEDAALAGEVARSAERIARLMGPYPKAKAPDFKGAEALSRRLAAQAVTVARRGRLKLPLKPKDGRLLVLFPDFREVRARFTFEGGVLGPERRLRSLAAAWGPVRFRRAPVESDGVAALSAEIDAASQILFFCFEARRFPGQMKTLELLNKRAPGRTLAALIRSPWDLDRLDPEMTAVDAKSYRLHSLEATMNKVLGLKP